MRKTALKTLLLGFTLHLSIVHQSTAQPINAQEIEQRIETLMSQMTLEEKIGQLVQKTVYGPDRIEELKDAIRKGHIGSILNAGDLTTANTLQKTALEESRLGIPLIFGRDVIHGYRTIFPIPLAQACSFDPELVSRACSIAALEAWSQGIHWTFAPMMDISRDPRWGRIAESFGEDPYLTEIMSVAMIKGFQGDNMAAPGKIAACAKHYVGYGAAEGGKDYNTTLIPESELRNVYLRPFHAASNAGVATFMSAFSDLNGIPASGNAFTLDQILRKEWNFKGFVVSDWGSVAELAVHGFAKDNREAALKAITAGVDMEMVTPCYEEHLADLVRQGIIPEELINERCANVLRIKFRLGLFENASPTPADNVLLAPAHLETARQLAIESMVLLQNDDWLLPLSKDKTVAVIGPLADAPHEQVGCWVVDGSGNDAISPRKALEQMLGIEKVLFAPGLEKSRSTDTKGFKQAVATARKADVVLLFLGEENILSGEAHCRAFLTLPGAQEELAKAVIATGKPVAVVIMVGRPLVFKEACKGARSILYAWHPGTMGGPAVADLLFGNAVPSAKLASTLPRTVGQVPLYYNHRNTGRPPVAGNYNIPTGTPLDPVGFTANYLDVSVAPEYPFGFGLSYTTFAYSNLQLSANQISENETLRISVDVNNSGNLEATEVVQLYIRDKVASLTRPVKELKDFRRVTLKAGNTQRVEFELKPSDLGFYLNGPELIIEPGDFEVFVGTNSEQTLNATFALTE